MCLSDHFVHQAHIRILWSKSDWDQPILGSKGRILSHFGRIFYLFYFFRKTTAKTGRCCVPVFSEDRHVVKWIILRWKLLGRRQTSLWEALPPDGAQRLLSETHSDRKDEEVQTSQDGSVAAERFATQDAGCYSQGRDIKRQNKKPCAAWASGTHRWWWCDFHLCVIAFWNRSNSGKRKVCMILSALLNGGGGGQDIRDYHIKNRFSRCSNFTTIMLMGDLRETGRGCIFNHTKKTHQTAALKPHRP